MIAFHYCGLPSSKSITPPPRNWKPLDLIAASVNTINTKQKGWSSDFRLSCASHQYTLSSYVFHNRKLNFSVSILIPSQIVETDAGDFSTRTWQSSCYRQRPLLEHSMSLILIPSINSLQQIQHIYFQNTTGRQSGISDHIPPIEIQDYGARWLLLTGGVPNPTRGRCHYWI